MHIINITKNKILVISFWFLVFGMLAGCAQKSYLNKAHIYSQKAQEYFQKSAAEYQRLIEKGKDLDKLYLGLGDLYYRHKDFERAIEAFKKTNIAEAKKFMAISYYRLGNFTDALEIFNKQELPDGEYLYYRGLTLEKLNLFDQALEIYRKIKDDRFKEKAILRINLIEKETSAVHIRDINSEISNILANAPQPEKYPQAGALILFCDERVEITKEGSEVSYLHYLIKILNERGKESFAETQVDYDSTFEKVELEYARTIKPDGTVVDVGSRHIRDVSKYLNFPLYSNARVYIISFPEIVEGSSIEYKLKIYRSQLINKKDFVLGYPVQSGEPIILANFTVSLPKEKPLHIKILNEEYNDFSAKLNPDKEKADDRLIYRWQFKDIPQIIPESGMPPSAQINPAILLSTFSNWQDIYTWWWALARDKINPDNAIKDKVKELVKDKISEEDKIRAIYNFCAQKIRYVAVEYGEAGYEPHRAADIFRNKYGDCKDQAILLITMLKEAGFSAWPVLIATKGNYNLNTDFPALLFNHCIAAVSWRDRIVFLDPTAETCSFGDLPVDDEGRRVLIFKESGYEIKDILFYPVSHNLVRQDIKIKVSADEAIASQKSVFTFGMYDQAQRFWLLYTPPELIQEALKEKIQDVSIGAKLDKYNIENLNNLNEPIVLSYAFRGPEYFTSAGILRIMPQLTGLDTSIVAKDKRRYPIDLGVLDTKETIFEIEIPSNFIVKYMPESIVEDSPWMKFIVEYNRKSNILYFKQRVELKKDTVSVAQYPDFKNFFAGLAKRIKQRIVLEKVK